MAIELAAVGTALGALKTISDIAKNVNKIELTQKIIELQASILGNKVLDTPRERGVYRCEIHKSCYETSAYHPMVF